MAAGKPVAGAILDVNLLDGDCTAVVEDLARREVPMIVQTGVGLPPHLARRYPGLVVHIKPILTIKLVDQLGDMLAHRRGAAD